jgi:hypothetical protein
LPTTSPARSTTGVCRVRQRGQHRSRKRCSVTTAGATGTSISSRRRFTLPPTSGPPHCGQESSAWITCRVGSIRRRTHCCVRPLRGCFAGRSLPVGRFSPGIPCARPVPLPIRLQRRHRGQQLVHPLGQLRDRRFQCGDPLLLPDDHPLLALDRFVLGDDEPDEIIAAGILEINHCTSIPRPLISEQIPNCPLLDCTFNFGDDRSERYEYSARKERYLCRSRWPSRIRRGASARRR